MLLAMSMTESVVRPVLLVAAVVVIGAVVQPSGGVWTNVLKTCPAEFVWSRSEILVPFRNIGPVCLHARVERNSLLK